MDADFDLVGLGNAIVDVIAPSDDDFLVAHGLHKGSMRLIDEATAEELYRAMGQTTVVSGGSAANTIIGAAKLGCRTAFIGKVKADPLGEIFAHDIRAANVTFAAHPAVDGPASARSLILVTPDGQRTMNTFLGACQALTEADIDVALIAGAQICYLEGYLWDPPAAKSAFLKAIGIAHAAGRRVALSLSDSFCVDRYRDEFLRLIRDGSIDILFANESELHSLYQTADFDTAVAALRNEDMLAVVTRSEKGCLVVTREETHAAKAYPVEAVIDTTGAGDLFAAGFLAGLVKGRDLVDCARLGALAAAEIIQHYGARPHADLAALAAENGLA
ncbi:MAG TPA: adenosine kinase [Methylovirgula sp.]|nr:adenosine kinase [Methylovirgula sp.]